MAEKSEGKNLKPELIAIFRLEFYRKQKNWKFCQDVKGKTPPDTPEKELTKHILNETYNIDVKPELESKAEPELEPGGGGEGNQGEELSELNQAFFDAGNDRNPDCTPPTTVSSQIWYNSALQAQQDLNWNEQIYPKPDKFQDNVWHDALQERYESLEYLTPASRELNYNLTNWPTHAHLWTDHHVADMDYSEVGPQIVDLDNGSCLEQCSLVGGGGGGCGGEPLNYSWLEHKHWPTPTTTFHTSQSEASLESLSQFVAGAAAAPHSSEMELVLPAEETHKRCSLMLEGCDEYPTRDNEPSFDTHTHDFIAGSFMNVPEGRGRGRGGGRRAPEPVIRIGMGRPYRLK